MKTHTKLFKLKLIKYCNNFEKINKNETFHENVVNIIQKLTLIRTNITFKGFYILCQVKKLYIYTFFKDEVTSKRMNQ